MRSSTTMRTARTTCTTTTWMRWRGRRRRPRRSVRRPYRTRCCSRRSPRGAWPSPATPRPPRGKPRGKLRGTRSWRMPPPARRSVPWTTLTAWRRRRPWPQRPAPRPTSPSPPTRRRLRRLRLEAAARCLPPPRSPTPFSSLRSTACCERLWPWSAPSQPRPTALHAPAAQAMRWCMRCYPCTRSPASGLRSRVCGPCCPRCCPPMPTSAWPTSSTCGALRPSSRWLRPPWRRLPRFPRPPLPAWRRRWPPRAAGAPTRATHSRARLHAPTCSWR